MADEGTGTEEPEVNKKGEKEGDTEERKADDKEVERKANQDADKADFPEANFTDRQNRKRLAEDINKEVIPREKKSRVVKNIEAFSPDDDIPMNIPSEIRNGIRYLAPYWTVYRTRAKGRWFGRKLVDVFTQEFLSLNPHYASLAVRLGRIWVNGQQMRDVNYVFQSNDRVEHWGHRHEHPVLETEIRVIADTDDLLVIDKPASLPVHACGQYSVHTILGQLRVERGITGLRVLHRLDRTTSGVLMFAKNYETDVEFKKTLKDGEWTKEYLLKVEGVFPEEEITVDEPIGTLVVSMGIQCVRPDGKRALTRFRRLWTDGEVSVVKAAIETGRTHQIRVHAQFLGYPIINDDIYNRAEVWGPQRGKGAEYGKSYDQLCNDVRDAHRASNWYDEKNPEYEDRMNRMAALEDDKLEMKPDPEDISRAARPDYDPICLSCNVTKKEVPFSHFHIFLHCLKYQTEKWCYSTPVPDWALEPDDHKHITERKVLISG